MIRHIIFSSGVDVPPDPPDPYWGNVVLAMHMDGADNGGVFTDETGKVVTRSSTSQVTSTTSPYFGTAALYVPGGYISTPTHPDFDFGTGDFTIELALKLSTGRVEYTYPIGLSHNVSGSLRPFQLSVFPENPAKLTVQLNNGLLTMHTALGTLVEDTWQHVAVCRESGTVRAFIDGVLYASASYASALQASTGTVLAIGGRPSFPAAAVRMDEVRVTKGVARYTANFTPPTAAFPNS